MEPRDVVSEYLRNLYLEEQEDVVPPGLGSASGMDVQPPPEAAFVREPTRFAPDLVDQGERLVAEEERQSVPSESPFLIERPQFAPDLIKQGEELVAQQEERRALLSQFEPKSYMEALKQAQIQDRLAAAGAGLLSSAEQIARIASRGVYQPTGMRAGPSAVSEIQQQREAVRDYLTQQRTAEREAQDAAYKRALISRMAQPRAIAGKTEEERAAAVELSEERAETERAKQEKLRKEPVAKPVKAPAAKNEEKLDPFATKLRNEFQRLPEVKTFNDADGAYRKMVSVAKNPSPAGDISLVFSFMKLNDPGSTVREGEQAQASNAANVPDRIRNLYNNVLTGQRLTPEQRADFLTQGLSFRNVEASKLNERADFYSELAKRSNIKVEDVLSRAQIESPVPLEQPQPAAGLSGETSLLPAKKAERLKELRRKDAEGTLGQ